MNATSASPSPLVLVVNDVESARYLLSRIVRSAGWRVAEAAEGLEAMRLARELKPDLVVLDVKLPDILGYEVCRRMKSDPETAGIPIIQTSATFVTGEGKARGLDAGADAYLTQPLEAIELIAMVRSLLRLRRTEAELRERARALGEADERKDEFLAMLAHELRNPLSSILVATGVLEDDGIDRDHMRRIGRTIGRQARHLGRLVDDLLDVSRITNGKIQLVKKPLDLCALVLAAYEGGHPSIDEGHHHLTLHMPDCPIWVAGDATRLEQVLGNLLTNALKYTPRGGRIKVSLTRKSTSEGSRAVFSIQDDGDGIAPENIGNIWDLFFQVDRSLARSKSGLGIGLTMVRRLVEMHGGTVSAASPGVKRGTEFSFELPEVEAEPVSERVPLSAATVARLEVLLVDDNVDSCELLAYAFERIGHQVTFCHLGQEALDHALGRSFDVAVLDIGLPDLDGYELAGRIKGELGGDAPFLIALTGYGRPQDRARALEAGFDVHLVKPVDVSSVGALFEQAIAKKRARHDGAPAVSTTAE
ncbi:MAG: histidine kinase [Labilithrix sp.]|nr:histidine kinase [Labilithrix sp.]